MPVAGNQKVDLDLRLIVMPASSPYTRINGKLEEEYGCVALDAHSTPRPRSRAHVPRELGWQLGAVVTPFAAPTATASPCLQPCALYRRHRCTANTAILALFIFVVAEVVLASRGALANTTPSAAHLPSLCQVGSTP